MFHAEIIMLRDCKFLVGQKGRKRVLKERRKNVHAGISGYICGSFLPYWEKPDTPVTYNPYKYDSFVRVIDKRPVSTAGYAVLDLSSTDKIVAWNTH